MPHNPILRSSMDSPDCVIFVPSKHDQTLLETLIHLPQVIIDKDSSRTVKAAVIAHPWSLLGGNMYDHVVQETFESLSDAGFLVAAFNSRGAGRSGGHVGASAATETADYESIIARLLSFTGEASVQLEKLYICGYSYGSFIASLVPPLPEGAETAYILISPLMTPIANFTTFFTTSTSHGILSKQSAETHREGGRVASILAIYGTGDIFAFSTGRYRRFFDHVKHHWGETAKVVEIADGGHFWLDGRAMKCLLEEVEAFIEA